MDDAALISWEEGRLLAGALLQVQQDLRQLSSKAEQRGLTNGHLEAGFDTCLRVRQGHRVADVELRWAISGVELALEAWDWEYPITIGAEKEEVAAALQSLKAAVTMNSVPTRAECLGWFDRLIDGSVTREDADAWASARMQAWDRATALDPDLNARWDPAVWSALTALNGCDLKEDPDTYLHDENDIREWRAELVAATKGT